MMTINSGLIIEALKKVRYPGTGKNIVESGIVDEDIRIEGLKVSLSLIFDKSNDPFIKSIVKAAEAAILTYISPEIDIKGNITVKTHPVKQNVDDKTLPNVSKIIAVASGKGGVGKSTIAANLAVALAQMGYKIGLLDADIYGPSQPIMFNTENERPFSVAKGDKDLIQPIEKYGVKLLSIGYFVDKADAVVWRGAMASSAIKQLLTETDWGQLDYLLIDLPPGTSDIHLTVVQTVNVTGAIVVGTPQEIALADVRKAINMFANPKINVPVLGLIENMAWFTPAELPDNRYYIFGKEGCARLAEQLGVPLLGSIPVVRSICESGDAGIPAVLDAKSTVGAAFYTVAKEINNLTDRFL